MCNCSVGLFDAPTHGCHPEPQAKDLYIQSKILHFVQNDPMGGRITIYSNWMNLQYLPSEYNGGALLMHNRSDSMLLNELMRCIMNWRCRDFSLTLHELHCDTMHYKRFLAMLGMTRWVRG